MLTPWPGALAYFVVFIAAVLEGEVVFVTASILVGRGDLSPLGVLIAAALGGSAGDQFWYYALRGRMQRWLQRVPWVARRQRAVVARVGHHSVVMILACRFLPGLRIAIPAACAYAGVGPLKFSALSLASALAWAAAIMSIVAWGGPMALAWIGLKGWWAIGVPAAMIVLFFRWLGKASSAFEDEPSEWRRERSREPCSTSCAVQPGRIRGGANSLDGRIPEAIDSPRHGVAQGRG